ncbi:MAG: MaoC family dehydratase [Xanthomonadales bacterium]|nr:MaoC family dehydratase [Xanthomonadales bacterium]
MKYSGKSFSEIEIDEFFESQLTVTETHIVTGAGLFGDFNPLHVSDQFCEKTRFGKRILHGPLTSALMSAPVGMYFAGTAVAYLEHNCQFKAPVYAGDTLTTRWTVTGKVPKPKIQAGIALLSGTCVNQNGVSVALAEGKIMLIESKD